MQALRERFQRTTDPEDVLADTELQLDWDLYRDVPDAIVQEEALLLDYFRKLKFIYFCLLYTSPSPRDRQKSRMPSSA